MAYRRRQQQGRTGAPYSNNYDTAALPDAITTSSASSLAAKAIRASAEYRDSSLSTAYEQSALSSPRDSALSSAKVCEIWNLNFKWNCGLLQWTALDCNYVMRIEMHGTHKSLAGVSTIIWIHFGFNIAAQHFLGLRAASLPCKKILLADAVNTSNEFSRYNYGAIVRYTCDDAVSEVHGVCWSTRSSFLAESSLYEDTPKEHMNESKQGFWGALARKAKAILDDDNGAQPHEVPEWTTTQTSERAKKVQDHSTYSSSESYLKTQSSSLQKGLGAIASSLQHIGGTIGNALEVRLQLETLLAEKARLAQENSVYARENRFLREIVEYHQLTMQDVVYLDEGSEEVTEVYPIKIATATNMQSNGTKLSSSPIPTVPKGAIPQVTHNVSPGSLPPRDLKEAAHNIKPSNPYIQSPAEVLRRH
ncbi:UNVERIFIED_CONTAM: hypothetical protein Sindi_0601500 [Sesamum indicum]